MKMIKKLVLLVVAAIFFTALNVHGYFDPSVGRWTSRDPVNEIGRITLDGTKNLFHTSSQDDEKINVGDGIPSDALFDGNQQNIVDSNPYLFVNNNAVGAVDVYGLLVLLEAHPVPGTGHNHSKITLMVNCSSRYYSDPRFNHTAGTGALHFATIGAGPGRYSYPWWLLIKGIDRPRDVDRSHNVFSTVIQPPSGLSDDDFIALLLHENSIYNNEAHYALLPRNHRNLYNSNGYASALLLWTIGVMAPRPPSTPGFDHPVPRYYFNNFGWP
jgi:hypothetical protein